MPFWPFKPFSMLATHAPQVIPAAQSERKAEVSEAFGNGAAMPKVLESGATHPGP